MNSPGATAAGILATSPATVLLQNDVRIARTHTTHERALTAPLHLLLLPLTPRCNLSLCRRTPRFGNAPRCHQPGVNVWHPGCPRRRVTTPAAATRTTTHSSQSSPPPSHRAAPPAISTSSESTQVTALRDTVATLKTRVTSLTSRFEAIETRLDGLVSKQATFEAQMKSVVESQQVIIDSISSLTEQLSTVASSLETLTTSSLATPPPGVQPSTARVTTAPSTSRCSPRGRVQ